jgi:hypothetical protein
VHLKVAGTDSALLTAVGTHQLGRQSGLSLAAWQDVRALDTVGSDTGALWFQALDWSQDGAGDTVVHRVFERRGSLLSFGLRGPEANGDVVVRTFGPQRLVESPTLLSGYSLELSSGRYGGIFGHGNLCQISTPLLTLREAPLSLTSQAWERLLDDNELHVLLSGTAEMTLRVKGIPYLAQKIQVRFDLQDTAEVYLDANRDGWLDHRDDHPGTVRLWSDMASLTRGHKLSQYQHQATKVRREQDSWAVDFHPLQARLGGTPACLDAHLETSAPDLYFGRFDSVVVQNRAYLFDSLKTREAMGGQWQSPYLGLSQNRVGYWSMGSLEVRHTHYLFSSARPAKAQFQIVYSYDQLKHVRRVRQVQLEDVFKNIAFYSARNPVEGDRENTDWPEGVHQYDWEDSKKLNEAPFGDASTSFPLARLRTRLRAFGLEFMHPYESSRADSNIVYIHGFNVKENMNGTFLTDKEVFKRLYRMGFKQKFASFHWFSDWTVSGKRTDQIMGSLPEAIYFNQDMKLAFQSSSAFYDLFYGTLKPGSVSYILAHSLGNQVGLDMLRLSVARGQPRPARKYVMFEAAVARETLHPYGFLGKNYHQFNDWTSLFRSSIRSDLDIVNVYNKDDSFVLGVSFPTAQSLKKTFALLTIGHVCLPDGIRIRTPELLAYCYEPFQLSIPGVSRVPIGYDYVPDVADLLSFRQVNSNWPDEIDEETDRKFIQEHSYYAFDPLYMTWDIYEIALDVDFH